MEFVRLEKQEHIGIITLNRPPVNALSQQAYCDIREAFTSANDDPDIWAVIFRAEGTFFSAGNELKSEMGVDKSSSSPYVQDVNTSLRSVVDCRVPVISLVHGTAVGAAFSMICYSDIVIATKDAKFGLPEVKIGIVGGAVCASVALPQKVARYMCLTADVVSAEQLLPYGFIWQIVPQDQLLNAGLAVARKICGNPPLGVRASKLSLNRAFDTEAQLAKSPADRQLTDSLAGTADAREAQLAFLEKRPPVYQAK